MADRGDSHSLLMGYLLWILGFTGAHRFYYGRPISGTIYFFTLGLLGVGWFIDLFLMPFLSRDARSKYRDGEVSYNMSWILLTFLGVFGAHRLYLGKALTAILYFFTGGLLGLGVLYDYWTMNEQVSEVNGLMKRAY
jgi:TM2 domain-containing membrane protein YozV